MELLYCNPFGAHFHAGSRPYGYGSAGGREQFALFFAKPQVSPPVRPLDEPKSPHLQACHNGYQIGVQGPHLVTTHRLPKKSTGIPKHSLYSVPQKIEKMDIRTRTYRPSYGVWSISWSLYGGPSAFSFFTMYSANIRRMRPCPASPNITANMNGNVMIA